MIKKILTSTILIAAILTTPLLAKGDNIGYVDTETILTTLPAVQKFKEKMGHLFSIEHEELVECFIFLNSGGVTSKTFSIPMNYFFLKMLNIVDVGRIL